MRTWTFGLLRFGLALGLVVAAGPARADLITNYYVEVNGVHNAAGEYQLGYDTSATVSIYLQFASPQALIDAGGLSAAYLELERFSGNSVSVTEAIASPGFVNSAFLDLASASPLAGDPNPGGGGIINEFFTQALDGSYNDGVFFDNASLGLVLIGNFIIHGDIADALTTFRIDGLDSSLTRVRSGDGAAPTEPLSFNVTVGSDNGGVAGVPLPSSALAGGALLGAVGLVSWKRRKRFVDNAG
jgi:LPXTG-motif cell wall-anchored protein